MPRLPANDVKVNGGAGEGENASPSTISKVDGGAAWACGPALEGARCSAATLEKAVAGGPCDGEGEHADFFWRICEALKRAERNVASGVRADGRPLPNITVPSKILLFLSFQMFQAVSTDILTKNYQILRLLGKINRTRQVKCTLSP
jgi:hypothetical protein